jgi:hypothetical protein
MKMKTQLTVRHSKDSAKRKVYSHKRYIRKLERPQIKNLIIYFRLYEKNRPIPNPANGKK